MKDQPMIVIRVKLHVKPEEKARFLDFLPEDIKATRAMPGNQRFEVYKSVDEEDTFLLYEEWDTLENFHAYKASDHFKQAGGVLFPMMVGEPDSAYFQAETVE